MATTAPQAADNGVLIIARKLKDRIRLYQGGLKEFIACSERFVRSQAGEFQIDTTDRGGKLGLKQASNYFLDHFGDIPLCSE